MEGNAINILSGGLGTDLFINGGYDEIQLNNDPLWSARVPYQNPTAIKNVHTRFLKAGSNVITTATYQASVQGYVENLGVTVEEAEQILRSCVDISKQAVKDFGGSRKIIIGGSVGPYGAMLHDRSEYTGSYIDKVSTSVLKDFHRTQMKILVSQGVDILACETLPAFKEAIVIAELLREIPGAKAWITFSTKSGCETSHGENLREAFQTLSKYEQVVAVGMNCSSPEQVLPIALIAKECMAPHQRFIAYPNNTVSTGQEAKLAWDCIKDIPSWLDTGVFSWIGGCCMVTPEHIQQIKDVVQEWESKN
uniref:Homocysteine S-methyltransferase 1-like n=1 Tax=Phallusia mammillata TaxID=59560 RepID=A0A6F9D7C9_9ASCI|nr:homocysteine S-methyltransferase 1-like [Phallusia mammillata]